MFSMAAALLAVFLLPGVAAALAVRARDTDTRLALGLTVALASLWLVAVPLATHRMLTPTATWITIVGVGVASLGAALWIRNRRHAHWLPDAWYALAAGAIGLVPPLVGNLGTSGGLSGSTSWYYWNLAQQTARVGGFPTKSPEWGTTLPFLKDYPGFTSATALLEVASRSGLTSAIAIRFLVAATTGAAFYLLARHLSVREPAALLATAALSTSVIFFFKSSEYRPESAGYALAFLVPVCALAFVRQGHLEGLAIGAIGFFALAEVHAIAWLFSCALTIGALVMETRRHTWRRALLFPAVAAGTVLIGSILLGSTQPGIAQLDSIRRVATSGADPTWKFVMLASSGDLASVPPGNLQMLRTAVGSGFFGLHRWPLAVVALLAAVGLGWLAWRGAPKDRQAARAFIVFGTTTTLVVLASCVVIGASADTWVPRRTGYLRVAALLVVLAPLALGVLLSALRRRTWFASGCAAVSAVLALALFAGRNEMSAVRNARPTAADQRALRELDIPSDAVVLTNAYTEGFVPASLTAAGLVDGRAPYTPRADLERANRIMADVRAYLINPELDRLDLRNAGVTHVLAADRSWSLGTPYGFATDRAGLDRDPQLRKLTQREGYTLYEVTGK
ncbi:MAG: hypothetical protein ACOYNI_04760 [Acidimicrobiia bacterium]